MTSRKFYHLFLRLPKVALLAALPLSLRAEDLGSLFYVREYRVSGATKLTPLEVQETVYPFLGPARTVADVEKARLALEGEFRRRGYSTVSVLIPQQDPRYGLIRLQVVEGRVGRLRVNGAEWFLPSRVKEGVPSLAEGEVPNLEVAKKELGALNRHRDRTVVPQLRAGVEPGTVDIDLKVEDKRPLHGSLELNNLYSANTTHWRVAGSVGYDNFFQRGDMGGVSFQLAPEDTDDALVFSGYYQSRINEVLSLRLQRSRQESDIASVGGASTVGKGETWGVRAIFDVPPGEDGFQQNLSLGLDHKDLEQTTLLGSAPVDYVTLLAAYGAYWLEKDRFTVLSLTGTVGMRGAGDSGNLAFSQRRYKASGNFLHLRGDISHTMDLKNGSQLFGKLQGQVADGPLIDTEQFGGGGFSTARGYLESSALGDNGLFATLEYRTPSFIGVADKNGLREDEWRIHAFLEGGVLGIYDSLPGQDATTTFASFGIGTRVKYRSHFNGSLDLAFPILEEAGAEAFDPLLTFRGWADF